MGNYIVDMLYESDKKVEQFIEAKFKNRIPIVDVELTPQIYSSHVGPCEFRWYRIVRKKLKKTKEKKEEGKKSLETSSQDLDVKKDNVTKQEEIVVVVEEKHSEDKKGNEKGKIELNHPTKTTTRTRKPKAFTLWGKKKHKSLTQIAIDTHGTPVIRELILISRAASYKPIESDGNHELLFHAILKYNSEEKDFYFLFHKTLPRPDIPPRRSLTFNEEFEFDSAKDNISITCATYNIMGDLFGPNIEEMEVELESVKNRSFELSEIVPFMTKNMQKLKQMFPKCNEQVFNFRYRRLVLAKEILTHQPDILCLQSVHRRELSALKSKLLKCGYSSIQMWNTVPETSHSGVVTFYKKEKLSKVKEYKIQFETVRNYKKLSPGNINPKSVRLIEKLCKNFGLELSELDMNGRVATILELDVEMGKGHGDSEDDHTTFYVANTHLIETTNMKKLKPHIEVLRLMQLLIVLNAINDVIQVSKKNVKRPCILFCADLSSTEKSLVYKFLNEGKLSEEGLSIMAHKYSFRSSYHLSETSGKGELNEPHWKLSDNDGTMCMSTGFVWYQQEKYFNIMKVSELPKGDMIYPNEKYVSKNVMILAEFKISVDKYEKEMISLDSSRDETKRNEEEVQIKEKSKEVEEIEVGSMSEKVEGESDGEITDLSDLSDEQPDV